MELLHVDAVRVAREVNRAFGDADARFIGIAIVAIILIRGIVAAATPISYDEAYYWMWSRYLAAGYFDHPPLIAFAIRFGTELFGDTSLGVRFGAWLLSIAASLAVWRAGAILLNSNHAGAVAALLFNLMPMIGIEALVATPDAPAIAASAFLLLTLAKLVETGDGRWWLATGVAAGFALLSKYTGLFLGAGILLWLALAANQRRWFLSVWPYLGGAVGLLMFVPVVVWNAQHDWISLAMQFGRMDGEGGLTLRFIGEFLAGQIGLATPFIAALAIAALFLRRDAVREPVLLLAALIAPALLYFLWHSLHGRVQGNWPSFLYPALAIAAAAAWMASAERRAHVLLLWSRRLAVPVAAAMLALIYAQALWGVIPNVRDPVSRLLGVNMDQVVGDLENLRRQTGAGAIVTTSYALTGWLSFYMPGRPVVQLNERYRYVNEPPPPAGQFGGPLLYVSLSRNEQTALLAARFETVKPLAKLARTRNGAIIDEYVVYEVNGFKGGALDQGR